MKQFDVKLWMHLNHVFHVGVSRGWCVADIGTVGELDWNAAPTRVKGWCAPGTCPGRSLAIRLSDVVRAIVSSRPGCGRLEIDTQSRRRRRRRRISMRRAMCAPMRTDFQFLTTHTPACSRAFIVARPAIGPGSLCARRDYESPKQSEARDARITIEIQIELSTQIFNMKFMSIF